MSVSRTGDAIVERAKECYELGLIDLTRLERVTAQAERPGYDPIMDLPFSWEVDEARRLARKAKSEERVEERVGAGWRRLLRR